MISINKELCIGCGTCTQDCFNNNIRLIDGKAEAGERCFNCGHCAALCPMNAISLPEYGMDEVEELDDFRRLSPEDVLYSIKARRSIRKFSENAVEKETLRALLQAGRYTATAKNIQGNRFIFVQDQLREFKELTWKYVEETAASVEIPPEMNAYIRMNKSRLDGGEDTLFRNAPVLLLIANERNLDAGLAAQNIENMACAMGMGALYNGYLCRLTNMNASLKEWLGAEDKPIQCCMLLGYPELKYLRTVPRRKADAVWL